MCGAAGVPRNLIIHFQSDTLDESPRLNTMMQQNGAVAQQLRYKVFRLALLKA